MHAFAGKARLHYGVKKEAKFNFLVMCSRMLHCNTQTHLDGIVLQLYVLLLSREFNERVVAIFDGIESSEDFEEYGLSEELFKEANHSSNNSTYRASTIAGKHYDSLLDVVKERLDENNVNDITNDMYNPRLMEYIYMEYIYGTHIYMGWRTTSRQIECICRNCIQGFKTQSP